MKQILTDGGMSLILRGLTGSRIEFTKIKFGNGEEQDKTAVDLSNPLLECPITSIARDTNFITLGTSYKNADVQVEFSAYETGVFAKDPDDETKDILYCLWYEDDPVKADYISPVDDKILETKIEFLVFVDNVEDVTAIISASMEYAPKTALDDHVNNHGNPHKVTASQVGLGNVPNVTPENQQPVFSNTVTAVTTGEDGTKSLPNIQNGDVMGSILQKIRSAISALISHLNAKNPHGLGASDVGAAASTHYHSASDINKGTLSLLRGGTGGTTAEEARMNIGAAAANHSHTAADVGAAASNHTHSYAGSSSVGGAANSAVKLSTARKVTVNLASEAGADFDGSKAITPGVSGILPITHGGTGAANADDARINLGIITANEIVNLYVWKKYTSDPSVPIETSKASATISRKVISSNSYYAKVQYADSVVVENGNLSLVEPSDMSNLTVDAANSTLLGKYVVAVNGYGFATGTYYIPSDAQFRASGTYDLIVDKATLLSVQEVLQYVASKTSGTYPASGTNTDGYWYEYHKQLGE